MSEKLILVVSPTARIFDDWVRMIINDFPFPAKYSYNPTQGRFVVGDGCYVRILSSFPDSMRGFSADEIIYLDEHLMDNFDEVKALAETRLLWKTSIQN